MFDLWRTYRFVVFTRKQIKQNKDNRLMEYLVSEFAKTKHRWFIKSFDESQVHEILSFAVDEKYLDNTTHMATGQALIVTSKGKTFISGRLYGFVNEALKKHGAPLLVLSGIVTITDFCYHAWRHFQ